MSLLHRAMFFCVFGVLVFLMPPSFVFAKDPLPPTIDCSVYPESSRESNDCYNDNSIHCQLYCECHPQSCSNPPSPNCSQFPINDIDNWLCHQSESFRSSHGTCREYCLCNRAACDNPPAVNCGNYPENSDQSEDCAWSPDATDCHFYCECHPNVCNNSGDCSRFPRTDLDDRWCQRLRETNSHSERCDNYCACNSATCDNPPPADCSFRPPSSDSSNYCASSSNRNSVNCQLYCECNREACDNPPPPANCSIFPRNDEDDRLCNQYPDSVTTHDRGTCREYCYCNAEGCAHPRQPPDCTLYPPDNTGRDTACSAFPNAEGCPEYCICNPERCHPNNPPEEPPSRRYCELFSWDLACFCPGRVDSVAECKAYCQAHPRRCQPAPPPQVGGGQISPVPPNLIFRGNIVPICDIAPGACLAPPLFDELLPACLQNARIYRLCKLVKEIDQQRRIQRQMVPLKKNPPVIIKSSPMIKKATPVITPVIKKPVKIAPKIPPKKLILKK